MARVLYGALVTQINGSIGGTVFQSNKYGFTAKNTPNMKFPNSPHVRVTQRLLIDAVKKWGTVSQSVRDNFNSYAAAFPQYSYHNPSAQLSGYSIAVRWWFLLGLSGFALSESFSSITNSFASVTPVLDESAGDFYIKIPDGVDPANILRVFFLSSIYPASRTFKPNNFRYMVTSEYPGTSLEINNEYNSAFGVTPEVGEFVFCKMIPYSKNCPQVLADQYFKIAVT
jgi:hypothetical protein